MSTGQKITIIGVSTSPAEEEDLKKLFFQKINVNLNEGIKGATTQVFLWFKKDPGSKPITRIEFSFNNDIKTGLVDAGYTSVNKDLNAGVVGDHIFLWYYSGSTESDIPIVDLNVSKDAKDEPALLQGGWERLGCDLNRGAGGNYIYLWVKREKPSYICEVTASVDFYADKHLFELGFTRVCENTNRDAGGNQIFIWYRRTTDQSKALTALDVSTCTREESNLQAKKFKKVNADLNTGTTGKRVYLWYIKGSCGSPIKATVLLVNSLSWDEYTKANVIVINKNLNDGNKGMEMYLAYQ